MCCFEYRNAIRNILNVLLHRRFDLCRKEPSDFFVVVGEHDVNATSDVRKPHLLEKFIVHEDYVKLQKNDIALIKVKPTIDFTVNVSPVCMPKSDDPYVYRKNLVSGWGSLASGTGCSFVTYIYSFLYKIAVVA